MTFKELFNLQLDLSALKNVGLVAPLTLAIAVAATVHAGFEGKQLMQQRAAQAAAVQLSQVPASMEELSRVAAKVKALSPDVTVDITGTSLVISGKDGTYPAWTYAVASVPGLYGKLVWTSRRLCVNSCGGGDAYQADLTAVKQVLKHIEPAPEVAAEHVELPTPQVGPRAAVL